MTYTSDTTNSRLSTPRLLRRILDLGRGDLDVVYGVPGDPLVGEASVAQILRRARVESIEVEIVHGISFVEAMSVFAWHRRA